MSPASRQVTAILYGIACHACFLAGVGTMVAMMYYGMSLSLGRLEPPWRWIANGALARSSSPSPIRYLLTYRGRALLARLGARRRRRPPRHDHLRHHRLDLRSSRSSPCGRRRASSGGKRREPLLVLMTALYAAAWLLLAKAMADAGLALQTGQPRLVGRAQRPQARLPGHAGSGPLPLLASAHLCGIRAHAVDDPNLDARPARRSTHADALLRRRAALQGGPLSARLRTEVRPLSPARALLAAVAAPPPRARRWRRTDGE